MDYEQEFSKLLKPLYISLENIKTIENNFTKLKCNENESKKESLKPSNIHLTSKFLQKSKHNVKKDSHAEKKFVCSHQDCKKSFGKHSRLIVHERTHTGDRPFVCDFENCDKSYTRQFHLTRHITISHSVAPISPKENYRCEKCEKNFSNPYSLKKHEKKIHKHKKYTCDECGQLFHKQQHLKTHSYVHTGIKPYRCEYPGCERRFHIPSRLKRHYLSHVKGRFLCPYDECLEKHDSYTELRTHLTIGHPKICDICGKEFSMLSRLKTHLATHTSIREAFFCPFTPCERYYFEERNLRNHICCKHNENFKGFTCHVCGKSLVTKQKLKLHVVSHESNKSVKSRTPKPRKPRKDKGKSRTDFAMLLSGYSPNDDETQTEIGGGDANGNLSVLA